MEHMFLTHRIPFPPFSRCIPFLWKSHFLYSITERNLVSVDTRQDPGNLFLKYPYQLNFTCSNGVLCPSAHADRKASSPSCWRASATAWL